MQNLYDEDLLIRESSYERGPIRPPSEASSLLVRLSRNCPWNQCTFCPVYKGVKFSKRSLDEVLNDIDEIRKMVTIILKNDHQNIDSYTGKIRKKTVENFFRTRQLKNSFRAVALWLYEGAHSVFLQDADPLAAPPHEILKIVTFIKQAFPFVNRITCYARSRTVARWNPELFIELRQAGLSRIHMGIESGNSDVLNFVCKGSSPQIQIQSGIYIKKAGMELSLYVMPGLGGRMMSTAHVVDTANVIRAIEPDFLRIRTLYIVPGTPLHRRVKSGEFKPLNDTEKVNEIKDLLKLINHCRIRIESDHTLNLLENISGDLPDDFDHMIRAIERFQTLPSKTKQLYIIGKRAMIFRRLEDLHHPDRMGIAEHHVNKMDQLHLSPEEYIESHLSPHL